MSTATDLLTLWGGVPSDRTGSDTTFSLLLQPYNVRSVTSFLSRAHHVARSKEGRIADSEGWTRRPLVRVSRAVPSSFVNAESSDLLRYLNCPPFPVCLTR